MSDEFSGLRMTEGTDAVSVLSVVGEYSETSIPLELAGAMQGARLRLIVAAYYERPRGGTAIVDVPVVHMGVRGRFDPRGITRLYHCIRKCRPDIVHVHHTVSALVGSVLAKLVSGTRVVRTEHDDHRYYRFPQRLAAGLSMMLSDRIVCNSRCTWTHLGRWEKHIAQPKCSVIYNGVDLRRIEEAGSRASQFRESLKLSEGTVLLGGVGRLVRQKNFGRLIKAIARVRDGHPAVQLVILGEGSKRERLEAIIRKHDLDDHVRLLGEVSRDDVYAWLHACDCIIVPSLWEGFCNAAVEAMAAARPMVVSDIDTLREVVGNDAIYIDPSRADDLAAGISKLLQLDESTRDRIGQRLQRRARERYSLDTAAAKYVETYRTLVGHR